MKRIRERWLHIFYGWLARCVMNLLGYTCRYEIEGLEYFSETATKGKCILMFWHNRLVMVAEILKRFAPNFKYAALISNSKDGEVISVLANSYKNGRAIRVPHNSRSGALKTLIQEMKTSNDIVIITPDGPKGPVYTIKPGVILASQKTGAQVVPLSWSATRYWKLSTWDGLMIPKPFSKIQIKIGKPLSTPEESEESKKILKESLMALQCETQL